MIERLGRNPTQCERAIAHQIAISALREIHRFERDSCRSSETHRFRLRNATGRDDHESILSRRQMAKSERAIRLRERGV